MESMSLRRYNRRIIEKEIALGRI